MIKRTIVAIGGYATESGIKLPFEPIDINQKIIELTGKNNL